MFLQISAFCGVFSHAFCMLFQFSCLSLPHYELENIAAATVLYFPAFERVRLYVSCLLDHTATIAQDLCGSICWDHVYHSYEDPQHTSSWSHIQPQDHSCGFDIWSATLTTDNITSLIVPAPHRLCMALIVADMFTAAVWTRGHSSRSHIWSKDHFCSFNIYSTVLSADNNTPLIEPAPHRLCMALFVADIFTAAVWTHGHSSCGHIWS